MNDRKPVRIIIADDHPLVLEGLQGMLAGEPDLHVVATATDGERALDAVRRFGADVLIIDLEMPYLNGVGCLQQIRAAGLPVRVLVLSAFGDPHSLRNAVESGADGFALKTAAPEATLAAIRQVAHGQLVFPQAARRWLSRPASAMPPDELTERETEVLAVLAQGASNAQIAERLHLSESTVKFHVRNLFLKLGVTNRTEAAARYHQQS